jgi:hypothetical protein
MPELFVAAQLPLLYLNRKDWYEVLYRLLKRNIQKFNDDDEGFESVCRVIELMAESYGEELLASGIVGELIQVTKTERSRLRELAGGCLAAVLLNAQPEICDQIAQMGGLIALCEIVGNVELPGLKKIPEAILKMVTGNQSWLKVVQESEIASLQENAGPESGCQDLIDALMNAVFPSFQVETTKRRSRKHKRTS